MDLKRKSTGKDKRKNNEKRKEKSRDAARCRRSRETEIFTDLANMLPLQKKEISQLDKTSVMRLAISYFKVRDMIKIVPKLEKIGKQKSVKDESVFLKSLEGFLLVLSPEGDFLYLSENVSDYIGITQIDLMGQNIYEYTHPCDHDEIKDMLAIRTHIDKELLKSFFIRLKCTLTNKGRCVNLKSASYKVIHCKGHIIHNKNNKSKNETKVQQCLVAVGQPIPHPSNIEAPLGRNTFLSKHSLDMKFTYVDDIMVDFLGYESKDLLGKSIYDYHHAVDSDAIFNAFKCLFAKGQCETNRYRFLAKMGGYVWVLTQATLIYDKIQKPHSVVCVNYVISGIECEDEIYSLAQASDCKSESEEETQLDVVVLTIKATEELPEDSSSIPEVVLPSLPERHSPSPPPRPQTATSKIFAPRTEEMNKGFLMFSDEEPGLTMLKDEPDDLTHLAPVAGDVCVPLEEHPFLSDMLDDFLLRDNFGPLLADEPTDPFISYRDSCDPSPQLLSPNLSKHSDSSLPSLSSPAGSLGDDENMSTFMTLQMDEEDPDLLMKAPYIPMNIGDDLPLLISDDLVWNSNSNDKTSSCKSPDTNSSLAQLLCSNINKPLKTNDHGGGGLIESTILDEIYNDKDSDWDINDKSSQKTNIDCSSSNKRSNGTIYDSTNKRCKNEPEEKMSSELLQQLMSSNTQRGRPKGKSNWLLDSGQKATCISQPSESVLMNLLDDSSNDTIPAKNTEKLMDQLDSIFDKNRFKPPDVRKSRNLLRKTSFSLLDREATSIASLLDLTQQDFEVNAPVNSLLLQGEELLVALEMNGNNM